MSPSSLAILTDVSKWFGNQTICAISHITTQIPSGQVTGLVGPDAAGKTTLLRLLSGLLLPSEGHVNVCGYNTQEVTASLRQLVSYMPQRFGLYEDLTVQENLNLYADLRGVVGEERKEAYQRLLHFTGLAPFTRRLAGQLSGGMKQKLGLACALVRKPKLLLLDEPSVGVDPISRRELWRMVYELVDQGIGVVWSTAYLDEAERCATVLLLNDGNLLYEGSPKEFTERTAGRSFLLRDPGEERRIILEQALQRGEIADGVIQGHSLRLIMRQGEEPPNPKMLGAQTGIIEATTPRFEDAFVDLLGGLRKEESPFLQIQYHIKGDILVAAKKLTKRFGSFVAANNIEFQIESGEIYGLLGPNGAGKSTIFKMMCGLLAPTTGTATVAGLDLYRAAGTARNRLGYMAQKFSLYGDLSVKQNLQFFAGIYGLKGKQKRQVIDHMIDLFKFSPHLNRNAGDLPLGLKQRLALACAVMHEPDVLFLDEPTSGVDPLTRREFWLHINAMVSRGVTVMVTTHFLDEAEYCDRISLIYRGEVIAQGPPDELKERVKDADHSDPTMEDAFIALIEAYDQDVKP